MQTITLRVWPPIWTTSKIFCLTKFLVHFFPFRCQHIATCLAMIITFSGQLPDGMLRRTVSVEDKDHTNQNVAVPQMDQCNFPIYIPPTIYLKIYPKIYLKIYPKYTSNFLGDFLMTPLKTVVPTTQFDRKAHADSGFFAPFFRNFFQFFCFV